MKSKQITNRAKNKWGEKKAIEKAIQLAKRETKEWQDFLIDCYRKLEKIDIKV